MKDLANLRRDLEATAKHKRTKHGGQRGLAGFDLRGVSERLQEKLEKGFSASLRSTKFGNGAEASREINQWVSDKTHGKITKTVGPDDFKSRSGPGVVNEPALVSVNAVYFKADWGSRFKKGATRDGPFHVNAATTENTPMMHQHSLLPYAENEEFKFLEIPYIDGQYSMYVLLPWKVLGVKELMSHVTARTVIDLKRSSAGRTVDVLLPKFEIARHYVIKDQLANMGVSSAFDKEKADFNKMIVPHLDAFRIYISQVYHDTWIEVHRGRHGSGRCDDHRSLFVRVQRWRR